MRTVEYMRFKERTGEGHLNLPCDRLNSINLYQLKYFLPSKCFAMSISIFFLHALYGGMQYK